MTSVKEYVI